MMYPVTKQPLYFVRLEVRLRTIRILWVASMMTTVLYALISAIALQSMYGLRADHDNPPLLSALTVVSLVSVSFSFVLKRRFYKRAVERGEPACLQKGFVFAILICQLPAMLAIFGLVFTFNVETYLLYALGALGLALHFPRRDQLAATYWRGF